MLKTIGGCDHDTLANSQWSVYVIVVDFLTIKKTVEKLLLKSIDYVRIDVPRIVAR